ncbi:MAG TPA: hypothetical protein VN698_07740 [Bacteroidia bacterium]|nr:hypothetical protein [Bacteroidia bacterium]
MRRIVKIKVSESIIKNKLIFQEDWTDKFDRFVIYLFFSCFLVYPIISYYDTSSLGPNDRFVLYSFCPMSILFGLYVIYRKATEKHLFKVNSAFDKQKNKQLLLNYAAKYGWQVYKNSNDCLIFNEQTSYFNSRYKKSMIFIVKDNLVLFTILKDNYRLNIPSLTSHLFLKHDLKKLLA